MSAPCAAAVSPALTVAQPIDQRPNVVLLVVDTLRPDHLGAYGYARATSPQIDSLLAARGVVFERVYAQAPWTVASMASMLTGRWPGEILQGDIAHYSVPSRVPVLAERLRRRGYRTAAFVASPVVSQGRGFARGFDEFHIPDGGPSAMGLHADDVGGRAVRWLEAPPGERPYFLYAHFIDPHDPYLSPDLVEGRSPFAPSYRGRVGGDWVQGLASGRLKVEDPAADLTHLEALYDSEIRYVDRWIGAVVRTVERSTARPTLFVLTSDHGEEFLEHGGWKHGHTLYEEQIRVPLILRWDGRLAPGRRVPGPVALIDVQPTVLAATGAASTDLPGRDLLRDIASVPAGPRRAIFAEHLQTGPRRASVVEGDLKYVLFDREAPFASRDRLTEALWRRDRDRLPAEALYRLSSDSAERRNLSEASDLQSAKRLLARRLHRHLDRRGDELRWVVAGLQKGEVVDATIEIAPPPSRWTGYFSGPNDRVFRRGDQLVVHLEGDGRLKGFRFAVTPQSILVGLRAPLPTRLGSGVQRAMGLRLERLRASWPVQEGRPRIYVWLPPARPEADEAVTPADESAGDLRALGYLP